MSAQEALEGKPRAICINGLGFCPQNCPRYDTSLALGELTETLGVEPLEVMEARQDAVTRALAYGSYFAPGGIVETAKSLIVCKQAKRTSQQNFENLD